MRPGVGVRLAALVIVQPAFSCRLAVLPDVAELVGSDPGAGALADEEDRLLGGDVGQGLALRRRQTGAGQVGRPAVDQTRPSLERECVELGDPADRDGAEPELLDDAARKVDGGRHETTVDLVMNTTSRGSEPDVGVAEKLQTSGDAPSMICQSYRLPPCQMFEPFFPAK